MSDQQFSAGVQQYIDKGQKMMAAMAEHRATMRGKRFDTIAVHGLYSAQAGLDNQGSIIEPGYLSTAQHFENSDHMEAALAYQMPGWIYSRVANPTVGYLEETVALLEGYGYAGDVSAVVTSSGMSAVFMATNPFLERDGDRPLNFVASAKCYGGTFMLFSERYARERGIELRWVKDALDLDEWAANIDENTRFLFGEMPSNPGLAMLDIEAVAALAHQHGIPFIIDSTVATPALMRPILHGADIVVQSMSKAMTAGGFAISGAVIARHGIPSRVGPDELRDNFALYVKLLPYRDHGPGLSPFNALMTLNDLRTLRSKVDQMSSSSLQVAQFLADHPGVEAVYYPGLPGTPEHDIARKYMWLVDSEEDYGSPINRFSHLMGFTVKGGAQAARKFFDGLQMIWRATDLGRVKTVATIPAISTHQQQGEEGRDLADVPPHLVRLSVGVEHPADIISDLEQALAAVDERVVMQKVATA